MTGLPLRLLRIHQSNKPNKDDGQEDSPKVEVEEGDSDPTSAWTTAWDEGSQAYYWWNMVTYETTWENPYEKNNTSTAAAAAAAAASSTTISTPTSTDEQDRSTPETDSNLKKQERQQHQYPRTIGNPSYTYQAYFNARTGRFQTSSDTLNPERMSIENRATRQMQYYFDVDAYTEERNRERAASGGQKRPLSKREIEKFKKARHEKKMKRAREWLCD
ncbi:hypothetical protein BX666DRAFT_1448526 [Dichotomocladium elegans]|nr:hypothetical protein BX666DRAFT_1448526 [Dichotomocladium elegans]